MSSSRRSKWIYYLLTSEVVCARYRKDKIADVTRFPCQPGQCAHARHVAGQHWPRHGVSAAHARDPAESMCQAPAGVSGRSAGRAREHAGEPPAGTHVSKGVARAVAARLRGGGGGWTSSGRVAGTGRSPDVGWPVRPLSHRFLLQTIRFRHLATVSPPVRAPRVRFFLPQPQASSKARYKSQVAHGENKNEGEKHLSLAYKYEGRR
jgi:hypothetical protein